MLETRESPETNARLRRRIFMGGSVVVGIALAVYLLIILGKPDLRPVVQAIRCSENLRQFFAAAEKEFERTDVGSEPVDLQALLDKYQAGCPLWSKEDRGHYIINPWIKSREDLYKTDAVIAFESSPRHIKKGEVGTAIILTWGGSVATWKGTELEYRRRIKQLIEDPSYGCDELFSGEWPFGVSGSKD
jgi:hypothetical protein